MSKPLGREDAELVQLAANGDLAALTALLLVHYDRLRDHVRRRIPMNLIGSLDVDDVVNETCARVARGIGSFRGESQFFTWVRAIAEYALAEATKRLRRDRSKRQSTANRNRRDDSLESLVLLLPDKGRSPSSLAGLPELRQAVDVAIACLGSKEQKAIDLFYRCGMTRAEAAEQMGMSESAYGSLIHRAKNKVKLLLGRASRYFSN